MSGVFVEHRTGSPGAMRLSINNVLKYAVLGSAAVCTVYPLLWVVMGSFKALDELYRHPWGIPASIRISNYVEAWKAAGLGTYIWNSLIVVSVSLAVLTSFAALSAYAFARLRFPGQDALFYLFLLSLMMPPAVLVLPIFTTIRDLGLLDTKAGLILVYSSSGLAFSVYLLRAYFEAIPRELEEAAAIDGYSRFATFLRVALPLAKPGLVTVLVFQGLEIWNEFFMALVLIRSPQQRTIPLGLQQFFGQYSTNWPFFFAALVTTIVPVILIFLFMQREFVEGLTAGAVKG